MPHSDRCDVDGRYRCADKQTLSDQNPLKPLDERVSSHLTFVYQTRVYLFLCKNHYLYHPLWWCAYEGMCLNDWSFLSCSKFCIMVVYVSYGGDFGILSRWDLRFRPSRRFPRGRVVIPTPVSRYTPNILINDSHVYTHYLFFVLTIPPLKFNEIFPGFVACGHAYFPYLSETKARRNFVNIKQDVAKSNRSGIFSTKWWVSFKFLEIKWMRVYVLCYYAEACYGSFTLYWY